MSPLFPRMTHPEAGYALGDLPDCETNVNTLETCKTFAEKQRIRLSFHPDQFVVLSSPHSQVVANSIQELQYQDRLAEAVGASVINIHAGGVYGDKRAALQRFGEVFDGLSDSVRGRLTLENDDVSYTPEDLLPFCEQRAIPFVYDVHHHRCNPDNLTIEEATERAGAIWKAVGREQYCHISSPKEGWESGKNKPHADYIDPYDVPDCWLDRDMTVDIEAKAKELAVVQLMENLREIKNHN